MSSIRLFIYKLVTGIIPETSLFSLKVALMRWCGASVGRNVRICSSAVFSGIGQLEIGDGVWVGAQTYISTNGDACIKIGSHVDIAPRVSMTTGTHKVDSIGAHSAGEGENKSISIGDGVWLGMGSSVLPGVTIGEKTVVAAGTVVVKSVGSRLLVAGVPAVVKKSI